MIETRNLGRLGAAIGIGIAIALAMYVFWPRGYCRSAKTEYGLELPRCPDGEVRQLVSIRAEGLQRQGHGTVTVEATAIYAVDKADERREAAIRDFDVELELLDAGGEATPLGPVESWKRHGDAKTATIELPPVPDGDYRLRATAASKVGEGAVEMALPLYAPARVHVLSDRPLYQPGDSVKLRAVVLRASDLSPIDDRPGRWIIEDAAGETLLEERSGAGAWGVASAEFPIERGATHGTWTARWVSGEDSGQASFRVEPFVLPRFRVEAAAGAPFYRAGQEPVMRGAVSYASGAPVAGAGIEIEWRAEGPWPPPPDWLGRLPRHAAAGEDGGFALPLPPVPGDLRRRATLTARITAVDRAGDRVTGSAAILLSEDPIAAEALTELEGGLVQGFDNRVYLRVTTADGRPLPGAAISVRRAWEPTAKAIEAELDADSVARVQLDPGPPVNVVVAPMPRRSPAADAGPPVTRTRADELIEERAASLADRAAMDRWLEPLASCARWVAGAAAEATATIRVAPGGDVTAAVPGPGSLSRCVADALEDQRLPAAGARLYALGFRFRDPGLPRLEPRVLGASGGAEPITALLAAAALDARPCLDADLEGELPAAIVWQLEPGARAPEVSFAAGASIPATTRGCILDAIRRQRLAEPATEAGLGAIRFAITRPEEREIEQPQPTIVKGYELEVALAAAEGIEPGATRIRLEPGRIPRLRLRPSDVLPAPGDAIAIDLLRGPDFSGELPEELAVTHRSRTFTVEIDREERRAELQIPEDASGWFELAAGGARARVFVRDTAQLRVLVSPEQPRYAPGDTAVLEVFTEIGGAGAPAAVGLFGVDASLGQLVALPGPGELGGMRPAAEMSSPAFGVLDAEALSVGRIRGGHAAEATVLRVSRVPEPAEIDARVSGAAETPFDPVKVLTERFYPILIELHAQARAWAKDAPEGAKMKPETMAALWDRALDALEARGEPVTDAFGRRLRLDRLPPDLLALTAPHQVVSDGTRLPEDVENWSEWVERRTP